MTNSTIVYFLLTTVLIWLTKAVIFTAALTVLAVSKLVGQFSQPIVSPDYSPIFEALD